MKSGTDFRILDSHFKKDGKIVRAKWNKETLNPVYILPERRSQKDFMAIINDKRLVRAKLNPDLSDSIKNGSMKNLRSYKIPKKSNKGLTLRE